MSQIAVIVADDARARIFDAESRRGPLTERETLVHPENRLAGGDLDTDGEGLGADRGGPGRHGVGDGRRSAQEDERFAREIARRLAKLLRSNGYEHLVLCAAPETLGRLRHHLPSPLRARVRAEIDKDLTGVRSADALMKRLPDPLFYGNPDA